MKRIVALVFVVLSSFASAYSLSVSEPVVWGDWIGEDNQLVIAATGKMKNLPEGAELFIGEQPTSLPETYLPAVFTLRARKARNRPAAPGMSVAHPEVTAGTWGLVGYRYDPVKGWQEYLVSNNHVICNNNLAKVGDPVLQPGPYDGGKADDVIAHITKCVVILFGPVARNDVDAGIALLIPGTYRPEIEGVGPVTGVADVKVGELVCKSGRNGYRCAKVVGLRANICVRYGHKTACFEDQIITDQLLTPGDSGSAVLKETKLIGLGFAGSPRISVVNPAHAVSKELDIVFLKP